MQVELQSIHDLIVGLKISLTRIESDISYVKENSSRQAGEISTLTADVRCLNVFKAGHDAISNEMGPWKRAIINWVVPVLMAALVASATSSYVVGSITKKDNNERNTTGHSTKQGPSN